MAESNNGMTVIGSDTHIRGEMVFEKAARILGEFEGKITAKGELQIADGATCKAEVEAGNVEVDGKVEGNLSAGQKVKLNAKAQIHGDITAASLTVADGASISGRVLVGPDAKKAQGNNGGGGGSGGAKSQPQTSQQASQPAKASAKAEAAK